MSVARWERAVANLPVADESGIEGIYLVDAFNAVHLIQRLESQPGHGPAQYEPSSFGAWQAGGVEVSALVKMLVAVAVVWFAWTRFDASNSTTDRIDSAEGLQALAKNVRAGEVVIYTTSVCPYSAQAKAWMTQYGFQFSECNAQTNQDCARQLSALTDTGVPYLIVRGHHMKNGFDSDEFISALQ